LTLQLSDEQATALEAKAAAEGLSVTERRDKGYSLTDCIPMQTMRQQGLTEVLTHDRHFEQEGFRALFG